MNRKMRRQYNKAHKTNFTRQDFDMMIAINRLKNGNYDLSDLEIPNDFIHMDNIELAPEGTQVKLNFDSLDFRCQHVHSSNALFRQWVEKAKQNEDQIYHLTREEGKNSLVCLQEDAEYIFVDGQEVARPKWLFDVYSDLLFLDEKDGQWKPLGVIEGENGGEGAYIEVKKPEIPQEQAEQEQTN